MSSPVEPSREIGGDGVRAPQISADPDAAARSARMPPNPASVKINVEGAFIVDDEINGKNGAGEDGVHYEHKDIRLPYHTAVVSHVAVDVSTNSLAQKPLLTDWPASDWRLTCEAGLLFARTRFCSRRWTTQLPQFRNRSDRPLYQFHSRSQGQAVQAQWIQSRGAMRHGHGRRRLQILQQNEGDLACGCHSRR